MLYGILARGCEDMMSLLRHFDRLQTMRDQLEAKLDLADADFSGSGGMDFGHHVTCVSAYPKFQKRYSHWSSGRVTSRTDGVP